MNIAIAGCGLMGLQRAKAVTATGCAKLTAVFDAQPERARALAAQFGCDSAQSTEELMADSRIDAVIVAVPHFLSYGIVASALGAGKHVLCEKPVGMTVTECRDLIARRREGQVLATGFNYRFYPGVRLIREMIREGKIGTLTHLRFTLGHGGRPGMESEWKMSKRLCGGGALLDPGIHMLDLVRYIGGEFEEVSGSLLRTFWNVDVEDNAFVSVRTANDVHAQLHISTTEWKSRMALDVFGTDGCIQLRGRSGFYGPQSVRWKRRWDWIAPEAKETVTEFPPEDISFEAETIAFASRVGGEAADELGSAEDCCRLLETIENLYTKTPVRASAGAAAVMAV